MQRSEPVAEYQRTYVLTNGNAGAVNVLLRLSVGGVDQGGYLEIDLLSIGADNYAVGGRAVRATVNDSGGDVIQDLLPGGVAAVDNQIVPLSPTFATGEPAAAETARQTGGPWRVYAGDTIEIQGDDLIQNETLTVHLHGRSHVPVTGTSVTAGVTIVETEE